MPRSIRILDVDVDMVTMAGAVDAICDAVDANRGHGAAPFQVATVNPEFVMLARRDATFRGILRDSSLRPPDAIGLVLAARVLGSRLPGRVPGVELVLALARAAAQRHHSLFLLGSAPGVAEAAAAALTREAPNLRVAGTLAGDASEAGDDESVAAVRASGADIVLVAFGAPAQDAWLARNLRRSGAAAGIGVGGSFDYLSGRVKRAPAWVRRLGFEWLWRLVSQPWRLRRQLVLPQFMALVIKQRFSRA
jgi:N-acetylglucosaminyldiphosphoundecaprenol N-acetyl-beta-D-mannosaminyltransferase